MESQGWAVSWAGRAGSRVVRRVAARNQQRVVVVGPRLIDRLLRLDLLLAFVALQLLAGLQADDVDLVAFLLEAVIGNAELGILEVHAQHASDLHRCPHSRGTPWNGVPKSQSR